MTNPDERSMRDDPGSRPNPDPTQRTIQQLQREIAALKELVFTRLDGMDKALELFQENIHRVPSEVDRQVDNLKSLILERFTRGDERFRSIDVRFTERDTRRERESVDAERFLSASLTSRDTALQAALAAQAMANAKTEAATAKAVDQLQLLIQTAIATLDGKIGDVKERITMIESKRLGQVDARTTQQGNVGQWVGIIGAMVGIAALAIAYTAQKPVAPVVIEQAPGNASIVRPD